MQKALDDSFERINLSSYQPAAALFLRGVTNTADDLKKKKTNHNNVGDLTGIYLPETSLYIMICRVHSSICGKVQSTVPSPQSCGTPNASFSVCHTMCQIQNCQLIFESFLGHNIFKCYERKVLRRPMGFTVL